MTSHKKLNCILCTLCMLCKCVYNTCLYHHLSITSKRTDANSKCECMSYDHLNDLTGPVQPPCANHPEPWQYCHTGLVISAASRTRTRERTCVHVPITLSSPLCRAGNYLFIGYHIGYWLMFWSNLYIWSFYSKANICACIWTRACICNEKWFLILVKHELMSLFFFGHYQLAAGKLGQKLEF